MYHPVHRKIRQGGTHTGAGMNIIRLQADGSLVDARSAPIRDVLPHFSSRVELADDFSLRGYFNIVGQHPVLTELNSFFPAYLEQYHQCPPQNCTGAGFDWLEFGKTIEMIGFPGEPRIDIYHSLVGVSADQTSELKSSRLEGLLDLRLKLGKLKHIILGDKVDIFRFDTVFNLFEFIDGIAWELSFHGTPDACDIRR